jgi:glycosyltransferase involved in cell wall biosynthesis
LKILFLTLVDIVSIENQGIYEDLLREISSKGHRVHVISPTERRYGRNTHIIREDKATILKVRTLNTQKTNLIEKSVSTVLLESLLIHAIKRHFKGIRFDLILYSTPPITFARVVSYVKNRDGAKTYLLLKDIFPQNAVDLGMMREGGLIHRYFRVKEKKLYGISDRIGCMSPANVDYVLKHNPEIPSEHVEVCPNTIDLQPINLTDEEKVGLRSKYGLPADKIIFVYGGNLGKPQNVPFIVRCIDACRDIEVAFFLIVGSGTDYPKLETYVATKKPGNVKLIPSLPKVEYEKMVAICDVGLIFLDHRFTIPNFPSRMLSYIQAGLPVLACTDPNTDIGRILVDTGLGWWCESDRVERVVEIIRTIDFETIKQRPKIDGTEAFFSLQNTVSKVMGFAEEKDSNFGN